MKPREAHVGIDGTQPFHHRPDRVTIVLWRPCMFHPLALEKQLHRFYSLLVSNGNASLEKHQSSIPMGLIVTFGISLQ